MKRLLIIAYDFPPCLIGVRRVLKWIRYLPEYGWNSAVLTVKQIRTARRDPAPLLWLKEKRVPVFRSGSLDPYRLSEKFSPQTKENERSRSHFSAPTKSWMRFLRRWIFFPDDRCGWIPFATLKGLKIIRKYRPDALLSTSHPPTSHIVGLKLKILTGLPWIADFRDGWTRNPAFFDPPTPLHSSFHRFMEKQVAKKCDLLLAVSNPITEHFRSLLPHGRDKIHTLTNGYDEEDFRGLEGEAPGKFTLSYTGTLYGPATPVPFFRALGAVLERNPSWRRDFQIRFYSSLDQRVMKEIERRRLGDVIRVEGLKPYRESLRRQIAATALLLFIAPGRNSEITMTQKVFEYLRSGRPILAMIPKGACRNLLSEFEGDWIQEPEDVPGIEKALEEMYRKWKSGRLWGPSRDNMDRFERRNLTRRLARYLDELMD